MSETTPARLSPGDAARAFRLPAIDGGTFDLANLTGRRYPLSFFRFASCPFCNLRVHELVQRFGELGAGFTIVAVFDSPLDNLRRHAERHAAPFPILADETGRAGLPVSTTHAIIGSLIGAAVPAYGAGAVQWAALGGKVVLPLLLTPALSLLLTGVILRATRGRAGSSARASDCLCAEVEPNLALSASAGSGAAAALGGSGVRLAITSGRAEACAVERPQALRLTLSRLHWLTSGATSLARGMNDAPKIVALSLAASALGAQAALPTPYLYGIVTVAMVAGSLVAGLRVTRPLAAGLGG